VKRTPLDEIGLRALSRGDIVCHLGSGNSYVIDAIRQTAGGRTVATAVTTVEVSNPGEWELVRYES
jgi:hypothetical protein